jgi:hypothetical protein
MNRQREDAEVRHFDKASLLAELIDDVAAWAAPDNRRPLRSYPPKDQNPN